LGSEPLKYVFVLEQVQGFFGHAINVANIG
jgi:hypothetical protein